MTLKEAIEKAIDEMYPETWGRSTRLCWYTDQYDGDYETDSFDQEQFVSRVSELLVHNLPENETIVTDANGKRFLVTVKEF